jgi:hypothetical protein
MRRLLFLLGILLGAFFLLRTGLWDGKSKFGLVLAGEEDIRVRVFDPKSETLTDILIPGETQVLVAGSLGSWKLESVWQLGLDEKKGGDLLARTVAKNFTFPVYAWMNQTNPRETNLKVGDRLKLAWFKLRVRQNQKSTIRLADFREFLREKTLLDGSRGYLIEGKVPPNIAALFSDEEISNRNLKARIIIQASDEVATTTVAQIIEVIGPKVAAINEEAAGDFGCQVSSSEKKLEKLLSRIFACQEKVRPGKDGFTVEIRLGNQFARIF